MNRTTVFALLTAAAVSACAKGTPEQQIVNDAAAALGGRDRILAVKTLRASKAKGRTAISART